MVKFRLVFSFSGREWLNYQKDDDELLLFCEVEELAERLDTCRYTCNKSIDFKEEKFFQKVLEICCIFNTYLCINVKTMNFRGFYKW